MPVTSSRSSVKRWPRPEQVLGADGVPTPDLLGADVDALPVPTDVLHYTTSELERVLAQDGRMAHVLRYEARFFVGGGCVLSPGTASPGGPPRSPA